MFNWFAPTPVNPIAKIIEDLHALNTKVDLIADHLNIIRSTKPSLPTVLPTPSTTPIPIVQPKLNQFQTELQSRIDNYRNQHGMGQLGDSVYLETFSKKV